MMTGMPTRKPNRLAQYDYSLNGGYFITICVHNRRNILSRIVGDGFPVPKLTAYGKIVEFYIGLVSEKFPGIIVDKYVIMPNHIHILAQIDNGPFGTGNPSPTIGNMVGWLKYQTTKQINLRRNSAGEKVWQRSYYDHVIRGQQDYEEIWQYIEENPLRWKSDKFF